MPTSASGAAVVPGSFLGEVIEYALDQSGVAASAALAAVAQNLGPYLASGASGSPAGLQGILTGLTAAVTGASGIGGTPSADALVDLLYSLRDSYARNPSCCWIDKATLRGIRKLKTSGGDYLFSPESVPAGRAAGSIFGYPVYTDQWFPATTTGIRSVLFGAVSNYWLRTVGAYRWERSEDFAFDRDVTYFGGIARLDGKLVDPYSVVAFRGDA